MSLKELMATIRESRLAIHLKSGEELDARPIPAIERFLNERGIASLKFATVTSVEIRHDWQGAYIEAVVE